MKHGVGILTAVFILASAESVLAANNDTSAYTIGDGVAAYSLQNYQKAADIWRNLAENGSADAAYRLAQLYDMGLGVVYDPSQVAKWLEVASLGEQSDAQYMLAEILSSGRGLAQNSQKAHEYYLKAASNGHGRAMYKLASSYYLGEGVEPDLVSAAYWFWFAQDSLGVGSEKNIATEVYNLVYASLGDEKRTELQLRIAKEEPVIK